MDLSFLTFGRVCWYGVNETGQIFDYTQLDTHTP